MRIQAQYYYSRWWNWYTLSNQPIDSKNSGINRGRQQYLERQITKGAEALKLIIKESASQNKSGMIADSAISRAKLDYGIFTADGSSLVSSNLP